MTTEERSPEYIKRAIDRGATREELAVIYADLLKDVDLNHPTYWIEVNRAILTKYKISGLKWIKARAWKHYEKWYEGTP